MEFNFFAKSSNKKASNPFLNRPKKEVIHSKISEEARSEEKVLRHSISKEMPKELRVTHAKRNPHDPSDLREVITHIQFPEDEKLCKATPQKVTMGIEKGYIIGYGGLQKSLAHAFCLSTIRQYQAMKDIYYSRTVFWFPKPIIIGTQRFYLAQDVAFYVQFLDEIRSDRISNRSLGYLVPQKVRIQPDMDNVVKKKNINKFKVGAKAAFNFFTRKKA